MSSFSFPLLAAFTLALVLQPQITKAAFFSSVFDDDDYGWYSGYSYYSSGWSAFNYIWVVGVRRANRKKAAQFLSALILIIRSHFSLLVAHFTVLVDGVLSKHVCNQPLQSEASCMGQAVV